MKAIPLSEAQSILYQHGFDKLRNRIHRHYESASDMLKAIASWKNIEDAERWERKTTDTVEESLEIIIVARAMTGRSPVDGTYIRGYESKPQQIIA